MFKYLLKIISLMLTNMMYGDIINNGKITELYLFAFRFYLGLHTQE